MQYTLTLLALAASAWASPMPGAVTSVISPSSPAPTGCVASYDGTFEITVVNVSTSASKRDLERRTALELTLSNSGLKDAAGRTGYIASNYQFQFDNPPQAGAIYTSGFSLCSNNTLALGGSAIWYQCLSGDFYNLYDRSWAAQCVPIYIEALVGSSSAAATQASDGQPAATTVVPTLTQLTDGQPEVTSVVVTELSDGQPQAVTQISDGQIQAGTKTTAAPVTQISDGQVQAGSTTAAPVSQISDGQVQAGSTTTAAPVSQISDGQVQAGTKTTAAPVSQISDGQVQAGTKTTAAPVTQISDGQVQAGSTTAAPVSQISDGQVQAGSTTTAAPVSQISDGQVQAGSTTAAPVSQISDGQVQAGSTATAAPVTELTDGQPEAATATSSAAVATFTGAAHRDGLSGSLAVVAGIAGAVILL